MSFNGFRRVNPAASLKQAAQSDAHSVGFRRVNPAASLKQLPFHAVYAVPRFRRVNPAASLKRAAPASRPKESARCFRRVNPAASLKPC